MLCLHKQEFLGAQELGFAPVGRIRGQGQPYCVAVHVPTTFPQVAQPCLTAAPPISQAPSSAFGLDITLARTVSMRPMKSEV